MKILNFIKGESERHLGVDSAGHTVVELGIQLGQLVAEDETR